MIKRMLILLFVVGMLLCTPASAANEVQNLTGIFGTTEVILDWDDVGGATQYNVYVALPSTFHTNNTSIVLDGEIDPIMEELAFQAVLFSPNPLIPDSLDTFYSLKNDTTIFFEANTYDSDVGTFDDWVGAYLDFGKDGLDSDDRYYRIQEDGDIVRQRWNGVQWIGQPGSAAQGAVANGGSTNPTYNLFIPQTEIQFVNNTLNGVTIEISHETGGVRSYSYLPTSASPTDGATYADLWVFGNESDADILFTNVTESTATITGLTSFDWVKFGVTSVVGGTESDITYISGVTEAEAYNISGVVYDELTGEPVRNALVELTCGCIVFDVQLTNNTGYFTFPNVFNETYVIIAEKTGYDSNSIAVQVAGEDVSQDLIIAQITEEPLSYLPITIFILFVIIDILLIYYSFTINDTSYYTDIITSLLSIFFSILIGYISYIGIGVNYALANGVQYTSFRLLPFGIIMGVVALIMLIFFIVKVLELGYNEAQEIDI